MCVHLGQSLSAAARCAPGMRGNPILQWSRVVEYIVLGTGYRIVVHEPYCSSSVVHQAHCCSVVTVNTKNSVQLLTLRYSSDGQCNLYNEISLVLQFH